MKKAADFFQNLRQGWITEKGAALCDNTLFLCDIWFLYRAPLSAALKNIDFTGFPHVFLWQRSLDEAFLFLSVTALNCQMMIIPTMVLCVPHD